MKAPKIIAIPKTELSNSFCTAKYNSVENRINGQDLKDQNNLPAFFTRKKRGVKKAWEALVEVFDENTTYSKALNILRGFTSVHDYCRMD